jgi:hypothetical protein
LVIEVLSPSETPKEIREKLRDYESIGRGRSLAREPRGKDGGSALGFENGKLERLGLLAEGILRGNHFPNVQIDVAEIWPE